MSFNKLLKYEKKRSALNFVGQTCSKRQIWNDVLKIYVKKRVCYFYGIGQFIGRCFASYFGPTISETENQVASCSLCESVMKEECRGMSGWMCV